MTRRLEHRRVAQRAAQRRSSAPAPGSLRRSARPTRARGIGSRADAADASRSAVRARKCPVFGQEQEDRRGRAPSPALPASRTPARSSRPPGDVTSASSISDPRCSNAVVTATAGNATSIGISRVTSPANAAPTDSMTRRSRTRARLLVGSASKTMRDLDDEEQRRERSGLGVRVERIHPRQHQDRTEHDDDECSRLPRRHRELEPPGRRAGATFGSGSRMLTTRWRGRRSSRRRRRAPLSNGITANCAAAPPRSS